VVYTQRPRICSTSYLAWELIEQLIAWRDDVFIYLTYPADRCEPEDLDFLSRHPDRVTLLDLPSDPTDRLSELYMIRNELRTYLNPWCGLAWDVDVVVSSRIPMLKHFPVHAARPLSDKMPWQRLYIGLEEMPILPFRDTVPWHEHLWADTLATYGLVDATLINNQWTKTALRPVLKEMLSPAWQKKVLDKIHEVVPVRLTRLNMRNVPTVTAADFNVGFVGRMTSGRNFNDVVELFQKHFSYPIGPNKSMKFSVSTNSNSTGGAEVLDMSFMDIQLNDREKFWKYLDTQHVVVSMVDTEDFSLSTWETLLAGVPMVLYERPWNAFLGKEYPFRVKNELEAYTLLKKFADDYFFMYEQFKTWEENYWAAYVADPAKNVTTGDKLVELVADFEARRNVLTSDMGQTYRERLQSIAGPTLDLNAVINETMFKMGTTIENTESRVLGRTPSTIMLKIVAAQLGWTDTKDVGVMIRE
jgi:hypothetical protein